jgi:hypothetical protein
MARSTALTISVLVVAISIGQVIALDRKFPVVAPTSRPLPVYLQNVGGFAVGFVHGHHGAYLVRIRTTRPTEIPSNVPSSFEVANAMREELRFIPLKLGAEAAWYFAIFFGVVFSPVRWAWRRRFSVRGFTVVTATVVFMAAMLLQAPIIFGYDESIFSTWAGPGAYSYSRPHVGVTGIPGVTVSYRTFLEAMISVPAKIVFFVVAPRDQVPVGVLFFVVALIYSLFGAAAGCVATLSRDRTLRAA